MTQDDRPPPTSQGRLVRVAFGIMALASVLLGLAVWQLAERMGLPEASARIIASAFIVAGIADALVLYFWERLFGPRR